MKTKLTLIFAFVLAFSTLAQVLPNDAVVDGKTIGEWSAEWWKWILPISTNGNPDLDTNGMFATVGQPPGDVFLVAYSLGILADVTHYTRAFTVPEGKYLFFPLELYEADNVDSVPLSAADLRAQDAAIVDNINVEDLHATLDGVEIPNLFDHRAISPIFNIFYANSDNLQTFAFGHPVTDLIDPMVCDGYWLMLAPLTPGPHVLHFGGSFSNDLFFPTDILDYITVVSAYRAPIADLSATPLRVVSPDGTNAVVVLDGSRSNDPDNAPLAYAWLEGASVLSMTTVSTNILTVGAHLVSLVVSNQHLSATNTITINVITAEDAVNQLVAAVRSAALLGKSTRPLLQRLEDASEHLHRRHNKEGIHELKEFQSEVHEHLKRLDAVVAGDFIQSAQEIIDALRQPAPRPPAVLPNDAVVEGLSIGDWSAEWWKWVFSIHTNQNPEFDVDGSRAQEGQPGGDVFFLGGVITFSGTASRQFSVPEDKYLFLPILNVYNDNVNVFPPQTIEELREGAAAFIDSSVNLQVSIDGIAVPNLFSHRAVSPPFSFNFDFPDNLVSYLVGEAILTLDDPIVSDGFWLMVPPLPPGKHVIQFGGGYGSPFDFSLSITDTITVVAIPLTERVKQLVSLVESSNLAAKARKDLLDELREAEKRFGQQHLEEAIDELREFQKKATRQVAPADQSLAQQLVQTAQTIIDKAKSARNLGRKNL